MPTFHMNQWHLHKSPNYFVKFLLVILFDLILWSIHVWALLLNVDSIPTYATSSSGSSSSSISDEEVDNVPDFPQDIGSNCFPHVEKFLPVKHRQTHRLHLLVDAEHTRLICGRALSQTYERLDKFPSHPLPTCVQCFASKLVGSFDECWEKLRALFCLQRFPCIFSYLYLWHFLIFSSSDIFRHL